MEGGSDGKNYFSDLLTHVAASTAKSPPQKKKNHGGHALRSNPVESALRSNAAVFLRWVQNCDQTFFSTEGVWM